jgi:hypothetical protein
MIPIHRISVLAILLGCNSSTNHHDITLIDAPIDTAMIDSPTGGTNEVEVQVFGQQTPDLLVYRDGSGSWLAPESLGNGRYALHVTKAYEVVAVCAITGVAAGYDAEELAATIDDARPYLFCGGGGSSPPRVAVNGTMAQAGTVLMSDTATSATGPWSFGLQVPTGTHDLVALAGQRILLQRGISITGPTTLPAVDVAAGGMTMTSVPLTITGTTDPVETTLELVTAHDDAAVSDTTNNTVALPPASLLQSTDFTYLTIDAPDQAHSTDRGISVFGFDGGTTAYALPDTLSGIAYATSNGGLDATWGPLPTYTALDVMVFAGSAASAQQHVMATANWVQATGATSLAFDTSAPGYIAGWKPDLTGPYMRLFSVSDDEDAAYYYSEAYENVGGAIARRALPRPHSLLARQAALGRR